MKILFVTGDHNCECEGAGIVQRQVKESLDPYDEEEHKRRGTYPGETPYDEITINVLCDCVKAMDATLEKFDDAYDADMTEGRVVPEEE